ncbi:MAG: ATP-binding cassette domain-containing protein [Candidatus Thorarchaeota archaeon]
MEIKIRGAQENNLKNIDVDIEDGLTAVTGVSGSGKTSLIFDTLYNEARRRFLETFSVNKDAIKINPVKVKSITGLAPTIALGQNILNRNPNSILASATGLIPLLKILYARFGDRKCNVCGTKLSVLKEDEIIAKIDVLRKKESLKISAILMKNVRGSHKTLIELLKKKFDIESIFVDGKPAISNLNPKEYHDIQIAISQVKKNTNINKIREIVRKISSLGANSLIVKGPSVNNLISRIPACVECGTWFGELEPTYFNKKCPDCNGKGCENCNNTGYHPLVSNVKWEGLLFPEILSKSVGELVSLFSNDNISITNRLLQEIKKRLLALNFVGLDYLSLDRVSPTLSRGESQRVKLAVALLSELEDIVHILDEPTIGQHPADIKRLMSTLQNLAGPVIYIEHDRQATICADNVIDIGPGAGRKGGRIVFKGSPVDLWNANTPTGKFFSLRERVKIPNYRPKPKLFLTIEKAFKHNLKDISCKIPLNRLTVVTGVSGSGKSTLVEDVLFSTLKRNKPSGCEWIKGPKIRPIIVDQGPIGNNPRSNPATYTEIADIIRKLFAKLTNYKATYFSFNTVEGQCPTCKGMGALEIRMKYLPSNWITCPECDGQRFSEEILNKKVQFNNNEYSIAEFYDLPISEVTKLFEKENRLSIADLDLVRKMLRTLNDIGLGYLSLGQASPTLSGGEAQRIKLSKYLGKKSLKDNLIILDEPSTGLHPQNLAGLLLILDRLIKNGATIVIVEHNIDIIRAADWIIDLGPDSGPNGGDIIYQGSLNELFNVRESQTAQALKSEEEINPLMEREKKKRQSSESIIIQNAHIHNLKNVSVKIPKKKLNIITGVSGSGKSSLIIDTIETEARRRYLETLSMYERQSTKESSEALVGNIQGLGITALILPEKIIQGWFFNLRNTIGKVTDIELHLANIFSYIGKQLCPKCNQWMERNKTWNCPKCNFSLPLTKPRHFISTNYSAACLKCHGVGSFQVPNPNKLIIHPEKPLCKGAMYSPGFFPKGYLCKPYNGGYYIVQALATRYNFDPFSTSWNKLPDEAKKAFLYGDDKPLDVTFENKKGQISYKKIKFQGFYGHWLRDWDIGGTYTDKEKCDECKGMKLRSKYLAISLNGYNFPQICDLPLNQIYNVLKEINITNNIPDFIKNSFNIILTRLEFLIKTGLSYINLNRIAESLSAGEAQRVRLAGLLGSDLTSLTILLDEPSRGLHPSELITLLDVLKELRNKGNTVIIIEHDPLFIEAADYIIDMGPGAGANGGQIVAKGSPQEIIKARTKTGEWISGKRKFQLSKKTRTPKRWLKLYGANQNNLKGDLIEIPHNLLVGICGVSGSGKSTLLIDTLGRALVPIKHTTSVSREPIEPGEYEKIEGALPQTILIDQTKSKIKNPLKYLGLESPIIKLYTETVDAKVLGLKEKDLKNRCSSCNGRGYIKQDMNFLPDIIEICEICKGSGFQAEAWQVQFNGVALPSVNNLTIEEAFDLFKDSEIISTKLSYAKKVGLGYLHLNQPARSLSGGEAQRLKIVKEISKKSNKKTLYILDEPTIGQHLEDVSYLIDTLHLLVDKGNSVIVIEHHPQVLASCDWLIELGPGAGPQGGKVIAKGPPEKIANMKTPTAPYLKNLLEGKN